MYIKRSSKAQHRPFISGLKHDALWSVLHRKTEISIWWLSAKRLNHHFPCKSKHIRCQLLPFSLLFLSLYELKTQCFLSEMLLILTLQRADNGPCCYMCLRVCFPIKPIVMAPEETICVVTLSSINMCVFEPIWPVRADVSLLITVLISSFRLRVHIISLAHWVIVVLYVPYSTTVCTIVAIVVL